MELELNTGRHEENETFGRLRFESNVWTEREIAKLKFACSLLAWEVDF